MTFLMCLVVGLALPVAWPSGVPIPGISEGSRPRSPIEPPTLYVLPGYPERAATEGALSSGQAQPATTAYSQKYAQLSGISEGSRSKSPSEPPKLYVLPGDLEKAEPESALYSSQPQHVTTEYSHKYAQIEEKLRRNQGAQTDQNNGDTTKSTGQSGEAGTVSPRGLSNPDDPSRQTVVGDNMSPNPASQKGLAKSQEMGQSKAIDDGQNSQIQRKNDEHHNTENRQSSREQLLTSTKTENEQPTEGAGARSPQPDQEKSASGDSAQKTPLPDKTEEEPSHPASKESANDGTTDSTPNTNQVSEPVTTTDSKPSGADHAEPESVPSPGEAAARDVVAAN